MQIGYYPGCSLTGTAREFDNSVRKIAGPLGLELIEVPDWNCCGATSAHATNRMLSLALPARVLALAEKAGLERVLVPCAACYSRLTFAHVECNAEPQLREKIAGIIDMPFRGTTKVVNMLELLTEIGTEKIASMTRQPLNGLKVACYYGCLLVRPPKVVNFDDCEAPVSMDNIVKALGGTPVDWGYKTECCGASFSISKTGVIYNLTGKILRNAKLEGAEAIAVSCPMCHSNLDMRQVDILKVLGKGLRLPVLYITELVGLALGISGKEIGLGSHFIDASSVLEKMAKEAK